MPSQKAPNPIQICNLVLAKEKIQVTPSGEYDQRMSCLSIILPTLLSIFFTWYMIHLAPAAAKLTDDPMKPRENDRLGARLLLSSL